MFLYVFQCCLNVQYLMSTGCMRWTVSVWLVDDDITIYISGTCPCPFSQSALFGAPKTQGNSRTTSPPDNTFAIDCVLSYEMTIKVIQIYVQINIRMTLGYLLFNTFPLWCLCIPQIERDLHGIPWVFLWGRVEWQGSYLFLVELPRLPLKVEENMKVCRPSLKRYTQALWLMG